MSLKIIKLLGYLKKEKKEKEEFSLYEFYKALIFASDKSDMSFYELGSTYSHRLQDKFNVDNLRLEFWNVFYYNTLENKSFYSLRLSIYVRGTNERIAFLQSENKNVKKYDDSNLIKKDKVYIGVENDSPYSKEEIINMFKNMIEIYRVEVKTYREDIIKKKIEEDENKKQYRNQVFESIKANK